MKKTFTFLLALLLAVSLCACGGTPEPTTEATTEPTTEATTEPVPDIRVSVYVPADWESPSLWAWQEGGEDVFETRPGKAMEQTGPGSYDLQIPGWADRVVVSANDGSVQTADLTIEPGKDVYIDIVNLDYIFLYYEAPTSEQLQADYEQPALDYHESFYNVIFRGGYQTAGTKFITYDHGTERYCATYIPADLLAESPEEVYYVVHLKRADKSVGYYFGIGGTKSAIKPGVKVEVVELATGKVVAQSEEFMGGDPPESITSKDSGRGTEPDPALIRDWIHSALEKLSANPPTEMAVIELNEEALTSGEKAIVRAKELLEERPYSYEYLVTWLSEFEDGCTEEEARAAADNCGADWDQQALRCAEDLLADPSESWTYDELVDWLMTYRYFTKEQAVYAADNCSADWNAQRNRVAQELLDGQADSVNGYYSYEGLIYELVNELGFPKADATAFADSCGIDWMENAKLEAQRLVDDELGVGYSERELGAYLRDDPSKYGKGFTREEAAYALENVKADWGKEAAKRAAFQIEYTGIEYTKDSMITELTRYFGFTLADATYGAEQNGLT